MGKSTDYKDERETLILEGRVASGLKEGKYFLSKERYRKQFIDKMDIDPVEGTLNVELNDENKDDYLSLMKENGYKIEGFEEGGKKYGDVKAFDASISEVRCGVIIPHRSDYEKTVEVISDHKLRDKLSLSDGDTVRIKVLLNGS